MKLGAGTLDKSLSMHVKRIEKYNDEMPLGTWSIKEKKTPANYSQRGIEISPSMVFERKIVDEDGEFIADITTESKGEAIANFMVNAKSDISFLLDTIESLYTKLDEKPLIVAEEDAIKEIEGLRKGVARLSEDREEWLSKYLVLKKKNLDVKKKEAVYNEAPRKIASRDIEIKKLKRDKDQLINTLMTTTRLSEIMDGNQTDDTALNYLNKIKKVKIEDIYINKGVLNMFKLHYIKIRSNHEIKGYIKRELKLELMSKGLI
jgi:hypothetical protein